MKEPKTRKQVQTTNNAAISSAHGSTITVSDLTDLVAAVRQALTLSEETPWWRGHANAEWRLEAHVYRKNPKNPDRPSNAETALIGHFVSRAPSRSVRPCPDARDFFGWLFLAQHYGLPTRLLDWSENPLVAVYFAVEQHPDDDGCIWRLSPSELNFAFNGSRGLVQIGDPRVAALAEGAFSGEASPEVIAAIDGQEIDPRMFAQMSRFTLHSDQTPLEFFPESANWLRRFVIPKDAKTKIRNQLSAFGIRRSNLFPDLSSLAIELKSSFW